MDGYVPPGVDDKSLMYEAENAIGEVAFGVRKAEISKKIEPTTVEIIINITTLEGVSFCLSLTTKGFKVVGHSEDKIESNGPLGETIHSLLDQLSPKYRLAFSNSLSEKLTALSDVTSSDL